MDRCMAWFVTVLALALVIAPALSANPDEGTAAKPARRGDSGGKAAPSAAKRAAKAPEPAEVRSIVAPDDLPMMIKQCRLTDAQSADLQIKFLNRRAALAEWDRAHGSDLAGLRPSAAVGPAAEAEGRLAALEAARARTDADGEAAILGALSQDQRLAWEEWKLKAWVLQSMMLGGLSDEQRSRIDALSRQAAQEVLASANPPAARHQERLKLKETVYNDVLTEVQRLQVGMKAAPASKPARAAGPTTIKVAAGEEAESEGPAPEKPAKQKPPRDRTAKQKPAPAGKKPGKKGPAAAPPLPTPEPVLP